MIYQNEKLLNNFMYNCITKRIKYLGKSSTKEVKDLCSENYKDVNEKVRQQKYKISCVHRLEELLLLKMSYYPKQCIDSIQSFSKYQEHFLHN